MILVGLPIALSSAMKGVWRFEDLIAWQLAVKLETITEDVCSRPAVKRDFKFHGQLADAGASAPRNIAEGFGRYHHPDFARFARIAKGSEEECLNHFAKARRQGYMTAAEYEDARRATLRALKAVNGLIRYLDATPGFGKD
jgi:four helix bundle protein